MKYNIKTSIIGKTDMGCVRTNNEDSFVAQQLWDENTYLAIAIDGVGGYEGGEIAADIARKTIPEFLSASSNGERVELLKQAVTAANNAIFDAREADSEHGQMSCVLTAAIIDVAQKQISMAHVGDSRLYSYHQGKLKKLSHDHSLIGYREEIGDLSEEEAMHHPQRNVIGRDVGSQKHKANDDDFIEAQVFPLLPNTTLLFCSDGLTDMITSTTITLNLSQKGSLEEKATSLIKAALDAGGKDNVTVVLFEYLSNEPETILAENAKEEKLMDTIREKQVVESHQSAKEPIKRNWLKTLLLVLVGLLAGFAIAYICINNVKNSVIKGLNDTIEQPNDTIRNYEVRINEMNAEMEQNKNVETPSKEKELEEQLNQANSTIEELRTQVDSLATANDNLKAENQALKTNL